MGNNIRTLDLSQNMLIGNGSEMQRLFELIGSKMCGLEQLILSETGCDDGIMDIILEFARKYPNHSLKVINVSKCDDLMVSQCKIDALNARICVIYDQRSIHQSDAESDAHFDSESELEFGFD